MTSFSGIFGGYTVAADADLMELSLDELAEVTLTSVSKRTQPLWATPAAAYVIKAEDIASSPTLLLPELLRQVPGMHVARINAHEWAIAARGFNSPLADKMEVRLDGRSLYTPLYSGVFWDQYLLPLEQIDRVEVLRGPAGTLWGSNAVNGVINIVSNKSAANQGLQILAGDEMRSAAHGQIRWGTDLSGASLSSALSGNRLRDTEHLDAEGNAVSSNDAWDYAHLDLRGDWGAWSLSGDYFDARESQDTQAAGDLSVSGHAFSLTHSAPRSGGGRRDFQLSWQQTDRRIEGGFFERRNTAEASYEQNLLWAVKHDLVWGLNYRWSADQTGGSGQLIFTPDERRITLLGGYLQDQWNFSGNHYVVYGTKLEHNDFTGIEWQPSLRWLWTASTSATVWAAVSRAVRTPNRLDHDARLVGAAGGSPDSAAATLSGEDLAGLPGIPAEPTTESCVASGGDPLLCDLAFGEGIALNDVPSSAADCQSIGLPAASCDVLFPSEAAGDLIGNRNFRSEELLAYEIGWRDHLSPTLSLDFAAYYNRYRHLRGVHTAEDGTGIISNELLGNSYGGELWARWQMSPKAQWTLGYSYLDLDLEPKAGSNDQRSAARAGNDPRHQATLRFLLKPSKTWSAHLALRHVGELKNQQVPAYEELDAGLFWQLFSHAELRLAGNNLLNASHAEFGSGTPSLIPRSVYATLHWRLW